MSDVLWDIQSVFMAGAPGPRLDHVTLSIRRGVTAVLGYSGAGKTSLLNLLAGFEKPDQGVIRTTIETKTGTVPGAEAPGAIVPGTEVIPLFWVPHNDGLWSHMTVMQHLEAVLPRQAKLASDPQAMLADLDLADKHASFPDQLSQGQRSRLAVARALLTRAAVLVMDEPLVHVDPARVGKYWDVIRSSLARTGSSLVFSTHSPQRVLAEAQQAICLDLGRVLYEGPVETLYHDPATEELALCMGEANWLKPDEAVLWLGAKSDRPRCYRPEQVALTSTEQSPIVVRSSRFEGSVAQVELFHEQAGVTRRFFHRPAGNHLAAGARVVLKLCLALLLSVLLIGCDRSPAGPTIAVKEVHYWSYASDGPKAPSPRKMTIGKNHEVIVLDTDARVMVYSESGVLVRQWRMPESFKGNPEGALLLKDGRIAVCDTHYCRIVYFDQQGKVNQMIGSFGRGPGQFIYPVTLTQDPDENLYVCEYGGNDRVQKFDKQGNFVLAFGSSGTEPGQLQRPSGLFWRAGKVYVDDSINNRVQIFSDTGKFIGILGLGTPGNPGNPDLHLRFPYDMCLAPDDTVYIVEWGGGCVTHITLEGKLLGRYGSPGIGEGQLRTPWGLALDPGVHLMVADTGNKRILELKL